MMCYQNAGDEMTEKEKQAYLRGLEDADRAVLKHTVYAETHPVELVRRISDSIRSLAERVKKGESHDPA